MAKIELTAEQKLAIMESELDLIWRVQEEWLMTDTGKLSKISLQKYIDFRLAYRESCEALIGAQICYNIFKRELETERETDYDDR